MRVYKRIELIRCLYCAHSFTDPEVGYDCSHNCSADYCPYFECDEENFNRMVEDLRRKAFEWKITK